MEIFKRIKGFDNYAISKQGNVKNIKLNKLLKLNEVIGNHHVYMYRDGNQHARSVSRLLAIAFINNPKKYKFIRLKNNSLSDIELNNIEWVKDSKKSKRECKKYKAYSGRLIPDYDWIEDIKRQAKEYDDKLNYFK